jgi:hypothetical protein
MLTFGLYSPGREAGKDELPDGAQELGRLLVDPARRLTVRPGA